MIFSPDLADMVLRGEKTQTRRRLKGNEPCRYRPGRDYAVQDRRTSSEIGCTGTHANVEDSDAPECYALQEARAHLRPQVGGRFDSRAAVAVIDSVLTGEGGG